jgi:CheY-like chemotaxis protein
MTNLPSQVQTEAKRILVIDDELDIRTVVEACLRLVGGYEVSLAGSGQTGLQQAQTDQPDAILLDVMLPDLDGPATLAQLQANSTTSHIPVIFLTAKVRPADQARFLAMGVRAVIEKPFDPVMLAQQVATILGWPAP